MNKPIYYAGIGSRKTPAPMLQQCTRIAQILSDAGYVLRTGGADGADTAFEQGANSHVDLYLPWPNFNNRRITPQFGFKIDRPSKAAYEIAEKIHPNWGNCSQGARALHARNIHQILGHNDKFTEISSFVFYWTEGGKTIGGTATALRLAEMYKIPCFWVEKYTARIVEDCIDSDVKVFIEKLLRSVP